MIEPKSTDIGRKVIYTPEHGDQEECVVTSFNEIIVYVRCGTDTGAKKAKRENLEWSLP